MATPPCPPVFFWEFWAFDPFELVLYIMWSRIQLYSFECEYLVISALFIEKLLFHHWVVLAPLLKIIWPWAHDWTTNNKNMGLLPGSGLNCITCVCRRLYVAVILRLIGFESFQIRNCVCVCVSSDFTFFICKIDLAVLVPCSFMWILGSALTFWSELHWICGSLGSVAIFTVLSLTVHEHGIPFRLFMPSFYFFQQCFVVLSVHFLHLLSQVIPT